jgi:hypothetical protein
VRQLYSSDLKAINGNADVIESLNEDDGLYYFDDCDTNVGMTAEEVDELAAE